MDIKVAYVLIAVMIGFVIAISVFSMGQESRAAFEANITKPGVIGLDFPEPQIDAIGTDDCVLTSVPSAVSRQPETQGDYIWSCLYKPYIRGLILRSVNATDFAVVVSYKDTSLLVPCHKIISGVQSVAMGPCEITDQVDSRYQTVVDLYPEFTGSVISGKSAITPPTINASSNLTLGFFGKILYNNQRIILGNYTFDVTVRASTHIAGMYRFAKDAKIKIGCGNETKTVELNNDESAYLVMCGHGVNIKMELASTSGRARFKISVEPWAGRVKGDPILVSFWKYDFDFWDNRCGGVQGSEYDTQAAFDIEAALSMPKCSERFLGGYELYAPVSPSSSAWIG